MCLIYRSILIYKISANPFRTAFLPTGAAEHTNCSQMLAGVKDKTVKGKQFSYSISLLTQPEILECSKPPRLASNSRASGKTLRGVH